MSKPKVTLRYPAEPLEENYQLLELPAEILKQIEGKNDAFPLTIKGRPSDDAVICTPTFTYLIRTVGISNSLLVCRQPEIPNPNRNDELEIRDVSHELLELVPQPPNLERIRTLLKPTAWKGVGHSLEPRLGKRKREKGWTRVQMESVIQASDAELASGLKDRNVVEIDNRLVMLPSLSLQPLLSIIFNLLTIHSTTPLSEAKSGIARSPSRPIIRALEEDHEVPPSISSATMRLFSTDTAGKISDTDVEWVADTRRMVAEVGRGLLEATKSGKRLVDFEEEWRKEVSDWQDLVDMKLLEGNYLLNPPPPSAYAHPSPIITYFPAHTLPLVAAVRFADLFLTRTPWKPDEMAPFLKGLYREGDTKERDKLVQKFVRVVKDKKGTLWFPRRSG